MRKSRLAALAVAVLVIGVVHQTAGATTYKWASPGTFKFETQTFSAPPPVVYGQGGTALGAGLVYW